MRTTRVLFSLPPALLLEAERIAKAEGRTKSQLFREALRRYVQERRWSELQQFGAEQARRLSLPEADVDRTIQDYRAGR